jgi:hypothetical protein
VYRTAIRLLRLADDNNVHVRLTKEVVKRLCATTTDGTMRSHLWQLSAANIIHYSTNADVYVNFHAYASRAGRAQSWSESAKHSSTEPVVEPEPMAETDGRAPDARKLGQNARNAGTARETFEFETLPIGSRLVGSDLTDPDPSFLEDQEPTNQPTVVAPSPDEQERSKRLLVDPDILEAVNVRKKHAAKILEYAKRHSFPWLVQQVAAWWRDMQAEKVRGVGALYNRIDNGWRLEPWPDEFLASDLYARHYPLSPAEVRRRAYDPDPPPVPDWMAQLPPPVYADEPGGAT